MKSLAAHKDVYWHQNVQALGAAAGLAGDFAIHWGFDRLRERIAELREREDAAKRLIERGRK